VDVEFTKEYPDKDLYRVFFLNFFCSVMVNYDHGSLPGCSEQMMERFHVSSLGFGSIGTFVYAGLTVGSALGTKAYKDSKNIKMILGGSLLMNGIMLIAFTIGTNFLVHLIIRFITGMFQVFVTIFTPVWADCLGSSKLKAIWISILLIASPCGVFLGFTITTIFDSYDNWGWEWSFYL